MVGTVRLTLPALLAFLGSSMRADEVPRVLFPEQLALQTDEWDGTLVQTTAHCIYTEAKVYRCIVLTRNQLQTRVEFIHVEPETIRNYIEYNCHSLARLNTEYCNFSIRFVHVGSEYIDDVGQYQILLIHAKELHATINYPDKWYRDEKPIVANCRDPNTYQKPLEERSNCPNLTREQVEDLKPNTGEKDVEEDNALDQIQVLDGQADENVSVPESETVPDEEHASTATPNSELWRLWEDSSLPEMRSARKFERSPTRYQTGRHHANDRSHTTVRR